MKSLVFCLSLAFFAVPSFAQSHGNIPSYLESNDWQNVTALFGEEVDFGLLDDEDLYTKAEATSLFNIFVSSNPCDSFKIIHEGTRKDKSQYKIGEYASGAAVYRITYFLSEQLADSYLIKQMHIELL